jgi:hypothetical protein
LSIGDAAARSHSAKTLAALSWVDPEVTGATDNTSAMKTATLIVVPRE